MIEHVYRRAAAAHGVDAVVVATDDPRIAQAVERFGGTVRMTRPTHCSGLDRVAEVAAALDCDIIVNVQGDEPAIDPRMIAQVIAPLDSDPSVQMSTLRRLITDAAEYRDPNTVKVVTDGRDNALYFSRAPVPFIRPDGPAEADLRGNPEHVRSGASRAAYKHVGLYAYRRPFLLAVAALPPTPLETAESLEQLRVLEHGFSIRAVETQYDSVGVDTPEDLERVRQLLAGAHA